MSEARDETIVDDAAPAAGAPQDDAPLSVEDRARAMGWKDDKEALGDRFVDAETFVKRGEEILPFVQATNRRLEQALEKETKERAKLEKTLERFAVHHDATEARAYERAKKEIEAKIDAAASVGDVNGVREGVGELAGLTEKVEAEKSPAGPAESPDFVAWKEENPWFGKDKPLTAAAAAIGQEVLDEGFTGKAQIAEVDKRIRAAFPSKFTNANRSLPGSVEAGGSAPRKTGKGYSDLPADAKAACDDFVKRVPGFTREKYCKDFFA